MRFLRSSLRVGPRSLTAPLVLLASAMALPGCDTTERTSDNAPTAAIESTTEGMESDSDFFGWLDTLNPFKNETRAAIESYRVVEARRPDGWSQVTVDVDLSDGDGPRSLLCAITRCQAPRSASAEGATDVDLITLIVRDDPGRMMLFDDAPAYLVVARERHLLSPLPPSADSVKRAADELQCRRSFNAPPGLFDRLVAGAPVQLVISIGGREVTRTIPGAACVTIESMGQGALDPVTPPSDSAATPPPAAG